MKKMLSTCSVENFVESTSDRQPEQVTSVLQAAIAAENIFSRRPPLCDACRLRISDRDHRETVRI